MTLSVAPPGVATSVRVNKKNEGGRTNQKGHHYFGDWWEGGRAQNKEIEAQSVTAQISSIQFAHFLPEEIDKSVKLHKFKA